jgi:hypothetical protein
MKNIMNELKMFYLDSSGKIYSAKRQSKASQEKIKELLNSQKNFESAQEILWAIENNTQIRPKCIICGGKVRFKDRKFNKTCSQWCAANDPIRKEKIRQTELKKYGGPHTQNAEFKKKLKEKYPILPGSFGTEVHKKAIRQKYGVDNVFQSEEIKNKIKKTNQERYGVDNPHQNEHISNKIKKTNQERYGQNGWNPSQVKLTNLKRYGVENPLQNEIIRNKIKKTNLERYGVEHVMHDPAIFDRCMQNQLQVRYKFKEMVLPSGKIIKYQGYENYVIQYLLDSGINENDLELERINVPVISYQFDGKTRRYYPDIFIKSKNMLIEVKSTYTFDREVEKNLAKHKASKDVGFLHKIIIWDVSKNGIFEVIDI